jgi:hypothetical protein
MWGVGVPVGRKHPAPRRVFLSHTSDLRSLPKERSYVAAAESAIVRAGHAVSSMGYFGAQAAPPLDVCRTAVRQAQVYVIIAGFRYGSPAPGHPEMSYCELEHEFAVERRIPRLVFLIDTDADGTAEMTTDGAHDDRQLRFRTHLSNSGVTVATVSDPAELETKLLQALALVDKSGPLAHIANKARHALRPRKVGIVAGLVAILGVAGLPAWIGSTYGNSPNGPEYRTVVQATLDWQASGVHVHPGETISITSEGTWGPFGKGLRNDADGCGPPYCTNAEDEPNNYCSCAIHAALIAKIGPSGRAFLVGRQLVLDPTAGGELHFRINDAVTADNDGELSLTLTRR